METACCLEVFRQNRAGQTDLEQDTGQTVPGIPRTMAKALARGFNPLPGGLPKTQPFEMMNGRPFPGTNGAPPEVMWKQKTL